MMLVWFRKFNSSRLSSFGNGWCFTFENSHSVRLGLHEVSCAFFLIKCQVFPKSLAALICWANLVNFVLIWLIAASLDSAGVEIEGGERGFDLILAISATFRIFSRTFRSVTQRRVSGRSFQISVISGVLELKLNFGWTFVAGGRRGEWVVMQNSRQSARDLSESRRNHGRRWAEWGDSVGSGGKLAATMGSKCLEINDILRKNRIFRIQPIGEFFSMNREV